MSSAGSSMVFARIAIPEMLGLGYDKRFAAGVVANGRDHVDTTVVVEHMAPGRRSRELFKAVLDGQALRRAVDEAHGVPVAISKPGVSGRPIDNPVFR